MVDCYYCNRDLELGPHDTYEHDVCHSEWESRIGNKMCGKCGANPRHTPDVYNCAECGQDGKFKNYLGPQ